mgnify:CR=1 FL=1
MRILFTLFLLCASITQFTAQNVYQKSIGGSKNDYGTAIIKTNDGGTVVAGSTESAGVGGRDNILTKLNAAGDIVWKKTYGNSNINYYIRDITKDNSGNIYVTGYTYGSTSDLFIAKMNGNGNLLWSRKFGGYSYDLAAKITVTSDGSILVIGTTYSYGGTKGYLLKVSNNGNQIWEKTLPTGWGRDVIEDSNGNYVIAGDVYWGGQYDIYLLKMTASGSTIFCKRYGGTSHDQVYDIMAAPYGYLVVGNTRNFGAAGRDAFSMTVQSNGAIINANRWGGSGDDIAFSIAETGNYIAGKYNSSQGFMTSLNIWTGQPIATKTYNHILMDVTSNNYQEVFSVGSKYHSSSKKNDIVVNKMNRLGFNGCEVPLSTIAPVSVTPSVYNFTASIINRTHTKSYMSFTLTAPNTNTISESDYCHTDLCDAGGDTYLLGWGNQQNDMSAIKSYYGDYTTVYWSARKLENIILFNIYRSTTPNFQDAIHIHTSFQEPGNYNPNRQYVDSHTGNDRYKTYFYWVEVLSIFGNTTYGPMADVKGYCPNSGKNMNTSPTTLEENTSTLKIFPNPIKSNDRFTMDIDTYKESDAQINIFSLTGQQVWGDKINLYEGKNTLQIPTTDYLPGIYLIQINTDEESFTERIIVE